MTTVLPDRVRVLISFHYFRDVDLDKLFGERWPGPPPEVFADSGAYSAFAAGADVKVEEYASWLTRWRHWFQVAANLDVIGDGPAAAAATRSNQEWLEDRGFQVLPVFHAAEPWEALEHYLDSGYPYLALGGLVGRRPTSIMAWLVRCFQMARGRAVFHGFGLTSWRPLADLPWFSVDSSTWGASYRYGQLALFDVDRGKWERASVADHVGLYAPRVAKLIREHGFNPADFADRKRYTRERTCRLSAVAWWRAEQWVRRRHGPITMPTTDEEGLRLYLAFNSSEGRHAAAEFATRSGLNLYLAATTSDLPYVKRLFNESHEEEART